MKLSLRAKTLLIWLCILLCLALGLSLLTVFSLAVLRDRLVAHSVQLAEEQIESLRDDLVQLAIEKGASSVEELKNMPAVRQRIEIIDRTSKEIDLVVVIDPEGVEVTHSHDSPLDYRIETENLTPSVSRPLVVNDRLIGEVRANLSHSRVFREIRSTSWFMTLVMVVFLLTMVGILMLLFFLFWRIVRRHIDSLRRQESMERMAYVGTLASGLAHEIRNPLNAMGIKLQLLEEESLDERPGARERVAPMARSLRGQIDRLNGTLEHFLTFALPHRRNRTDFDLCGLIREVHDLLRPEFAERGVEWRDEMPEALIFHGEQAAFHEVAVNIMLNALQALERVDERRRLTVSADERGDAIRLEFADTGPGVADKDLRRIFDVFYSTREGGSGFGLAIAQRIVEDHDGSIEARNRPEGGASFVIRLPQSPADAGASGALDTAPGPS